MQISNFSQLAQELVEAVSSLVRMRTVNVMDLEGIIIASTEPERIGTLHTGAREVARTGKELLITPEMLPRYPGAKTGYNMPLSCRGETIGVIGIYGTRSDVTEIAHLLRVYAEKYFDLETVMNRELADVEKKGRFFQLLGSDQPVSPEMFCKFSEVLGFRLQPPFLCVRIRLSGEKTEEREDGAKQNWRAGALLEKLVKTGLTDKETDICGTEDGDVILIRSMGKNSDKVWKEKLHATLKKTAFPLRIFCSKTVPEQEGLQNAYRQTVWMSRHMPDSADLSLVKDLTRYITARTAWEEAEFLELYVMTLQSRFRKDELDAYLRCMRCYLEEDGSVGRTAEKLFIHKNTVQYRVRRLYEALSLQNESEYVRRYLMRLLLGYVELV